MDILAKKHSKGSLQKPPPHTPFFQNTPSPLKKTIEAGRKKKKTWGGRE